MIKKIIEKIVEKYPRRALGMSQRFYFCQENLNLDLCNKKQRRVLISYIPLLAVDYHNATHAQSHHANQILHYFISRGFCVDICRLDDMKSYYYLRKYKYDVIFGFGPIYKKFCNLNPAALKICFIMENNPEIVKVKYKEREDYFKERHPKIKTDVCYKRMGYFDEDQFYASDAAIIMNSRYNTSSFEKYFKIIKNVNCNAFFNDSYKFEENIVSENIESSRNNYLWFGSRGILHKGVDILVDAFKHMPELQLDCYGIYHTEKNFFNKIKNDNTIDCSNINVNSEDFIKNVVNKHNFIIFPSCSEGMSTAVATCMAHGIIPIISKETGYNSSDCIIELSSYRIEDVVSAVRKTQSMTVSQILDLKKKCFYYAREKFSLQYFNNSFSLACDEILTNIF